MLCGTGKIGFIPRFFVFSGTAPRVPRMRSGADPGQLLRVIRNLGFWWGHRFPDFYRIHRPGFVEEFFPGVILVYLFDGDRGAEGSGMGTASRRKNSGEKLFCDVQ